MKNSTKRNALFVAQAGIIAALYAVLTIVFAPISYGMVQFRISEMLCVLPFFTPAAVPGLFVGCLIANLFSIQGMVLSDVVFGSLATLAAAFCTYLIGKLKGKFKLLLAPFPAVFFNTLIIPFVLKYGYGVEDGLLILALFIFIGEAVSCYALGLPFAFALLKLRPVIFKKTATKKTVKAANTDESTVAPDDSQ